MTPTVVALGGHVLAHEDAPPLREALAPVLDGRSLVVTHGNGPQVGAELLHRPETPIHVAVARTQGELGSLLATQLDAVPLVTHVVVSANDPAFSTPTKPIGPFYDEATAHDHARDLGWQVAEEAGRGWRRVVPSPLPLEVVELAGIRALLAAAVLAVACGGGGIPVVREGLRLRGVDAVIDKDHASALLAVALGATELLILTDVDALYRDFRSARARPVQRLTPDDADALLPELAPGSMRPKLEAAAAFVRRTGGEALITSPDALAHALAGTRGTRVAP